MMFIPVGLQIMVKMSLPKIDVIKPPNDKFSAIIFGRINKEDDSIKNGLKAAEAFGLAAGESLKYQPDKIPYLTIVGLSKDDGDYDRTYAEIKEKVTKAAGRAITINALSYLEERDQLFNILKHQHLCIMPSWHEGFGLVGWEAIAAGIPLIVSKNSGLYRHLCGQHKDLLAFTNPVDIKNTEEDKAAIKNEILKIKYNYAECKAGAVTLRQKLKEYGYTWEKCSTFC